MPLVHNRGRVVGSEDKQKIVARKIIYPKDWDANGKPEVDAKGRVLSEVFKPGEHKTLTDRQFAFLKEMFPREIINLDDMRDMRSQFEETAPAAPRAGYVAPDEVDALVAKRVAEELAKARKDTDGEKVDTLVLPESHEELIKFLDPMDRGDLIALIENHRLEIDHKSFKKLGDLKGAVLTALESNKAAV